MDLKKTPKKKFCIFFQSTLQVGMKNIVECYKEFFGYFNALETNGALTEKIRGNFQNFIRRLRPRRFIK